VLRAIQKNSLEPVGCYIRPSPLRWMPFYSVSKLCSNNSEDLACNRVQLEP
jgi:hypothetical protein